MPLPTTETPAPAAPPAGFAHQTARVNGVALHYVIGGRGPALVLLHGFGQNWYMWDRLLPALGQHFTVVAPDLRGVGESDKPAGGYDKQTMATDIHALAQQLGFATISLAGHDIGLMVAYAYAAQYPAEVRRLALLDALLPGVEPVWAQVSTTNWWFGFFARPIAGELVAGHERAFLTDFWGLMDHVKGAFTPAETAEFIRAYAQPGATTGSFHWFGTFPQDARDNLALMQHPLPMPVLAMGSEFSAAPYLAAHARLVATHVAEAVITGAGHWLVQEQTAQVQAALLAFFLAQEEA